MSKLISKKNNLDHTKVMQPKHNIVFNYERDWKSSGVP